MRRATMDGGGVSAAAAVAHDVTSLLAAAFPSAGDKPPRRAAQPDAVFEEILVRIEDERRARVERVDWLHAHIQKARASAAAHDRESARRAVEEYAEYNKTGLPQGRSRLTELLDANALRTSHLVLPAAATSHRSDADVDGARVAPPRSTSPARPTPHYLLSTSTAAHRETGKVFHPYRESADPRRDTLASRVTGPETAARGKVWAESMDSQQREEERHVLARMGERANFLRNPRNDAEKAPTASSFVADPAEVVFSSYAIGRVYEMPVVLRNVGCVGRRVRVLPPASTRFAVLPGRYPAPSEGSVAPGMCAHYVVRFLPDSLDDAADVLRVEVEDGTVFDIPLAARRLPPALSLPDVFDLGPCLVGDTVTHTFDCVNAGGSGRFALFPAARWDAEGVDALASGWDGRAGPFSLSPCVFALQKGERLSVSARFAPAEAGAVSMALVIVCDNGRVRRVTLSGFADVPRLSFAAGLDGALDAPVGRVLFGDLHPREEEVRSLTVRNDTTVDLPFEWLCDGLEGTFAMEPPAGVFPAASLVEFKVSFLPGDLGFWTSRLQLTLTELPAALESAALCLPVDLEGTARPIAAMLRPPAIVLPRDVCVGHSVRRKVRVCNASESPARFCWRGMPTGGSYPTLGPDNVVSVTPDAGVVPAADSVEVEVEVRPRSPGPIADVAVCLIEHAQPIVLHVEGRAVPPRLAVHAGDVDFGLVSVGTFVPRLAMITNPSPVPVAWSASLCGGRGGEHVEFNPADGTLAPGATANVRITLHPREAGPIAETVCFQPEGGPPCLVSCHAEVVSPSACVLPSRMCLDDAYVGVTLTRTVVVRNLTLLPTPFAWAEVSTNTDLRASFTPRAGVLEPGQELLVEVAFVAAKAGPLRALLSCSVADGAQNIGFSVESDVRGLSVSYCGPNGAALTEGRIDFGLDCPIGQSRTRAFEIVNHSAIPAPFAIAVERHASKRVRPVSASEPFDTPRPSADGHVVDDGKRAAALAGGTGAAFEVSPAEGWLSPFSSTVITVQAYNDMWGVYEDRLRCDVGGLEASYVGVCLGVVGSPLRFRETSTGLSMATSPPTMNFGSQPFGEKEVVRMFRVENSSPFDIQLDWQILTRTLPEDSALVDLRVCVDEAGAVAIAVHNHDGIATPNPPFRVTSNSAMVVPARGSAPVHLGFRSPVAGHFNATLLSFMRVAESVTDTTKRVQGELTWPLRMALTGHSAEPRLAVDAGRVVRFKCASADLASGRLVVRRSIALSNNGGSALSFTLGTESPFCVADIESLTQQTKAKSRRAQHTLQPKDNIGVVLEFAAETSMLSQADRSADVAIAGSLVIRFSNGSEQVVELEGLIQRPRVTVSSTAYDFGTVLVRDSRGFSLEITNVSACEAPFECELVGDGVFAIAGPSEGRLASHVVARERHGQPSAAAGPPSASVSIRFAPREPRRYTGLVRVAVEHGAWHEVRLIGYGSVDERMYNADRL